MRNRFAASMLVLSLVAAPAGAAKKPDALSAFDALAGQARMDWGVPGLAVVVVRDGKVLLAKGYGVREQGKPDLVDADTLFAAGSTTKAMTAVTLGLLVDEGKLSWDDKVRKHIPELQLGDAALADSLTVRDLLTHHTGLPETDYLWYAGDRDWPAMLRALALVSPTAPVRSRFEYQNVMYAIAGDLAGRVAGVPWPEFLARRVFAPLGMSHALALGGGIAQTPNHVTPHSREDGPLVTGETLGVVDPIPSAGSVWLSANDEARWLEFLLDPGAFKDAAGKPLLQAATIEEIFSPVVIQHGAFYPTADKTKPKWTTYGLGWFQQDYRGRRLDFHTGSIDGLVAIVGLVRDEHFGIAVFANLDHAELRHALLFSAIDLFLDGSLSRDWNGELRSMYADIKAKADKGLADLEAKRVPGAPPQHPLAAYAGTYSDPLRGTIQFTVTGDHLTARLNELVSGPATAWHYETFEIVWNRKLDGKGFATFRSGIDGVVSGVEIDGVFYVRKAEKAAAP